MMALLLSIVMTHLVGVTMGTMVMLVSRLLLLLVTLMVKFMTMMTMTLLLVGMVKFMATMTMRLMVKFSVGKTCSTCILRAECFSRYHAGHSVHILPLILAGAIGSISSYYYYY